MNFELDEFGLDEPLLDDVQGQNYASFLLDQPLDLFDELNDNNNFESQDLSSMPGNQANQDSASSTSQDSFSSSTSSQFHNHNTIQLPIFRRDSSDESDVGIVDDIIVQAPTQIIHQPPQITTSNLVQLGGGTKRAVNGGVVSQQKHALLTYPPNAFIQKQPQIPTAVIKLEPLAPQTPQIPSLTLAMVDDKLNIAPKPCLVISPNGALTPFSLHQQQAGKLVNVKDIKIAAAGGASSAQSTNQQGGQIGLSQQQHDEAERQAKRQMRVIKNREAATLSRQRQKAYLESLEERVRLLARENEQVKHENEEMKRLVERLHEENVGLRGSQTSTAGSVAFSSSSSVSSPEDLSPVSLPQHDSPIFISAAPSPPPLVIQPQIIKPQVIDLDEEPVPKKILLKPAVVPVITLPVSIVGAKQPTTVNLIPASATTISRDSKAFLGPKIERLQPQAQPFRRVFVAARTNSKVLLIFSLIFAFNCIPFASKMFRESSTTVSPIVISSGVAELSYSSNKEPLPQIVKSQTLDGGRILYPANFKAKREAIFDGNSDSHDLMILPPSRSRRSAAYFEYDIVDTNDLPLIDDALVEEDEPTESRCPKGIPINTTHSLRIVNALSQWASLQQQKPAPSKVKPQTAPFTAEQARLFRHPKIASNDAAARSSSDLQLYRRRSAARQHQMLRSRSENGDDHRVETASDEASSLAQYEKFANTIRQRNDTFYMVSFHVDQLIFPALIVNRTSRPKMSLILPALFSLNETVSPPDGSVALMQIECEVNDMKILHLGKHLIPLDIVLRHMRDGGAHADATNRMYRQWLYGKATAAP